MAQAQDSTTTDLYRQLDCAAQYVEQILRPVGGECTHAQKASDTKKRKRASPFLASHGRDFMQQLSHPGTPTTDLIPLFNGELRHYQLQGIKWLYSMYTNGLASILADESAEDRMVQVAGLISYMRSKGMCGPLLLVAPASSQPDWCQHLQQLLGDGLCLHMLTDDSSSSMQAMHTFCDAALHRLAQHADTLTVPPSGLVVTDPEVLVRQQAKLAQQHFKFLIVDTVAYAESPLPASPCGSVAAPEPEDELQRTVSLPPTSRPTRLQGQRAQHGIAAHHTRRHTITLPAAANSLRVKSLPLATRSKASANVNAHRHHDRAGPGRGHGRRTVGPATLAGKYGGSRDLRSSMDEDPGHDQLVLSLSRLSSHGDANEEEAECGQSVDQTVVVSRMATRARSTDLGHGLPAAGIQRAQSGSSSQTAMGGPFAVHLSHASQACSRPPRPSTRAAPQPPPVLQSVGSWPSDMPDTVTAGCHSRSKGSSSFTAGLPPGLGCNIGGPVQATQLPPWLAFQQQLMQPQGRDKAALTANLWMQGPVTRSRSSSLCTHLVQHMAPVLALNQQPGNAGEFSNLQEDTIIDERGNELAFSEEGGVLSNAVQQAVRNVLQGASGNVVLLAAGAVPEACSCESELWPLLSLLLHTAVEPLQACVQRAAQAGLLRDHELASNILTQLRALVDRFMLRRAAGDTSLDSLRNRSGPECNLYDLFARAD